MATEQFKIPEGNLAFPYDRAQDRSYTNNPWYYQTEESMDRFEKYLGDAMTATKNDPSGSFISWGNNFENLIKKALENEEITTKEHQKLAEDFSLFNEMTLKQKTEAEEQKAEESWMQRMGINQEPIELAKGGPLMAADGTYITDDEQEIMDELLASYGGNEMREYVPGPFEKQEQAIESFLSGIGRFAGEKEIPFLKALADPYYAKDVAGKLSFGTEMTPGVGDVQALREGAFMMGEGQPKMGAAFMAGSLFTGMSSTQLKAALKKLQKELDETIPALRARSQSNWRSFKETRNKGDEFDAKRLERQADRSETRNLREQEEIKELLKQGELPLGEDVLKKTIVPPLTGRTKMSFKFEDIGGLSPLFRNLFRTKSKTGRKTVTKADLEAKGLKNIEGNYWQDPNTKQVYRFPEKGGTPRPITVTDAIMFGETKAFPSKVREAVLESKIGMPRNTSYLDPSGKKITKGMTPYQPNLLIDRKGKQIIPFKATVSDLPFERMIKKFKDENPGVRISRESRTADQIGKDYDKMFEQGEYTTLDPKRGEWGTNPEFAKTQDVNIQFNDGTYSKYPLREPPEQAKGIGALFKRYKDDLADPEKAKHIGPYEDWVRERQQSAVREAQEKIEKFSLEDVDDLSAEEMRQLIKILSGNEF